MSITHLDKPGLDFRAARRLSSVNADCPRDVFLVCAPTATTVWQQLGRIELLIPGLAKHQVANTEGAPLVIDEGCLQSGAWSGSAGSTGEKYVAELVVAADYVRNSGGVVIGVTRDNEVPDVNLQRIRDLYELRTGAKERNGEDSIPRILRQVLAVLNSSPEGTHA